MAIINNKKADNNSQKIENLVEALGSKDWKEREDAAIELTTLGRPAIIGLLKALNSDNTMLRSGAAEVLGTYGEAALPTLLKLVAAGKENTRDGAARAIAQSGETALNELKKAAKDKDYRRRRGAALTLAYLGYLGDPTKNVLLALLRDSNEKVSFEAAKSLKSINWEPENKLQSAVFYYSLADPVNSAKYPKEIITLAMRDLNNPDDNRRKKAIDLLAKLKSESVKEAMLKYLDDSCGEVRFTAIKTLSGIYDREMIPCFVTGLKDTHSGVRLESAWALDKYGWNPVNPEEKAEYYFIKEKWIDLLQMKDAAVPVLIKNLCDENPVIRLRATEVLRAMGKPGYLAIKNALKSDDENIRKRAAEAVAIINKKDSASNSGKEEPIPEFFGKYSIEEEIKKHKSQIKASGIKSRDSWLKILLNSEIEHSKAEKISGALSNENDMVRAAAIENLRQSGISAIEPLLYLLIDKKDNVKIAAIESLGDLKARRATPYLIKLCGNENRFVRMACAESLGKIREIKSIDALTNLFSDPDESVRKAASAAVSSIGPDALPKLKSILDDSDMTVRTTAIRTISGINDPIAISYTVRMLNDYEFDVRECASKAIKKMSNSMFNPLMDECRRIIVQGNELEKLGILFALADVDDLRAKEIITVFADDRNPKISQRAADLITKTGKRPEIKTEIIPELKYGSEIDEIISGLRSTDTGVQVSASEKVFSMGDEIIEPLIESMEKSNPEVQNLTAEILIGLGDPAIDGLVKHLSSGSLSTKMICAQSLGKIQNEKAYAALSGAMYNERDPVVRTAAAESLGFAGDDMAFDALIFAIKDEDSRVRIAAIRSLGYLNSKKAIKPLISALKEEDLNIINQITDSLKSLGEDAVRELSESLHSCKNSTIRYNIAEALDSLSWVPETERDIIYYLIAKDNWEEVRKTGEVAVGPLEEILSDDNYEVRLAALETIIAIGGKKTIMPMIKALMDPNSIVRKKSEAGLVKAGESALPYLEKTVAESDNPNLKTFAMKAIVKITS
ncbi:HEAT repeat domain-containing protein [Methanoplanus endosymbiosus]|uniref:HEAT repeat domain-containing protein n=1 Tax=Methanoplanus endosymbiosus TaxID=33865 RepID=A0A9E7PNF5_9EURY|nr:HEAT repeat domain-containing protein [Methanoplanus endosymbiosus]UUX93498.1 HEAT repeat domain-containing protein [Methanoplanus endosymbiosus]